MHFVERWYITAEKQGYTGSLGVRNSDSFIIKGVDKNGGAGSIFNTMVNYGKFIFIKARMPFNTFFPIKHITMKKNNESTVFVVGVAQVTFFLFIMLLIGVIVG